MRRLPVVAAHGARSGAGGVEQDLVEGEERVELARIAAHDLDVLRTEFGQVVFEFLRARAVELARRDAGRAVRERRHLAGLAAGCGAHVEDIGACVRGERERGQHGGEALQVDLAVSVDVEAPDVALACVFQYEGVRIPWDARMRDAGVIEGLPDALGVGFERVGAQGDGSIGRCAKAVKDACGIGAVVGFLDALDDERRQGALLCLVGHGVLPIAKGWSGLPLSTISIVGAKP